MVNNKKCIAVITAAGSGKRMGLSRKKQFIALEGKPVIAYTLEKFQNTDEIDDIVLVVSKDDMDFCRTEIVEKYGFSKVKNIISGGAERQESVCKGVMTAAELGEIILIHDGVRPFVKKEEIVKTAKTADEKGAAILAVRVKDSLRSFTGSESKFVPRENMWLVQTPQGFQRDIIVNAHKKAEEDGFLGTDDAVLAERLGWNIFLVEGSYDNIKITTPEDLVFSEAILKKEREIENEKS